jgi:Bacteriophage tail sheath protein
MPITPSYPGLYIEEIPSNSHTITAAPTSITVFIGYTHPFQTQQWGVPVEIFSFSDYERFFGGFFNSSWFNADEQAGLFSDVAMAVYQFFQNGGSQAYVVGLQSSQMPAASQLYDPDNWPSLTIADAEFQALVAVDDLYQLTIEISNVTNAVSSPPAPLTADLTITYQPRSTTSSPVGSKILVETYPRVNFQLPQPGSPPPAGSVFAVIQGTSKLVGVAPAASVTSPPTTVAEFDLELPSPLSSPPSTPILLSFASMGPPPQGTPDALNANIFAAGDFTLAMQPDSALDKLAIFNLLVLPGVTEAAVLATASSFSLTKRAFFIMDPPPNDTADGSGGTTSIGDDLTNSLAKSKNSALYFPYLQSNHPLTGEVLNIPPSGTVAGIFAEIDQNRGVWKAPAGLETLLNNVTDVIQASAPGVTPITYSGQMTDQRQGVLNLQGVNCIRNFPAIGPVVFGARTTVSANLAFQDWKYVPVRRMALFLEQTLYANLGWVVFEPNDEPLWLAIRSSIESFMLGLFRQHAFQGDTPSQAFQVKCDAQTTTQDDINNGIVNIVVAFAPLKPAEFVVIQITQLAGQTQTS